MDTQNLSLYRHDAIVPWAGYQYGVHKVTDQEHLPYTCTCTIVYFANTVKQDVTALELEHGN